MESQPPEKFPSRGPAVFAVTTTTLTVASVFVAGRMWSRIGIVRRVGWDDYIIVFAWLIAFFLSLTIDFATERGLGRHDADISTHDRAGLRMCEYIFSVLYNPALMATKTSILIFYLRLSRNTNKILRMASWVVLAIVNIAGTILTFMNIFQCQPLEAAWDLSVRPIKCIPLLTEFICSAPVNVVTDLAILALPLPVLTGMRLPQKQKTILIITFTVGIFVTVVDVVRIYYLQQAINIIPTGASNDPDAIFGQSAGFPWNASLSLMWSAVEVNVGITCACVPTLKPLIIKILPAMIIDPNSTQQSSTGVPAPGSQQVNTSVGSKTDRRESSQTATWTTTTITNNTNTSHTRPQAPESAHVRNEDPDEISFRDFLASTPPMDFHGTWHNRSSLVPGTPGLPPANTIQESSVYFGFVNMKRPKSMIRTSASESFKYCSVVSILFFLWGFSYGLLNTLNNVVADVAGMTRAQTLGLTSLYFGAGYLFGPILVGEWLLRHDEHHRSTWRARRHNPESVGGFKATFIVGLLIYGVGTIMFWPGAVLNAYGGFMVSSFVVGFGLAVLETAANPFLALCGPPQYSDARLLLAQGVQAVGSVLSGLLANNVFFTRIEGRKFDSMTLIDVQWTYLAATLLCVLLGLVFYYMPLPEVTDRELGRLASRLPVDPKKRSIGGMSLRTWSIILAVASQWTYVAAQENMSIYFNDLLTTFVPPDRLTYKPPGFTLSVLNYLVVAHTVFAISRFTAGFIAYLSVRYPTVKFIPTPRTMLLLSAIGSVVFMLVAVLIKPSNKPDIMAVPMILFFLAEGPMWPLIFSLGLKGQGKRTKRSAAWLTMGASGPAFWPFVSYSILENGGSIQTSFIVVVALVVVSLFYPLFLTFVKDARLMVDATISCQQGTEPGGGPGVLSRSRSEPADTTMTRIIAARKRQRSKERERDEKNQRRASNGGLFGKFSWPVVARRATKSGGGGGGKELESITTAIEGTGGDLDMTLSPLTEHHEGHEVADQTLKEKALDRQEAASGSDVIQPPEPTRQPERAPWDDTVLDTKILEN
ncbi:major facilitator superfamily domain-containing protein [Rhypophila decipiens]|uniref:Major facilitator superfamily domain-containing protein n=1 Tax=Rhypophila decipiens TaxID=261697 RepID=A0AAN6Y2K0_9PEZI|nr:major facilitator superfamily domain-containing protein [Rhypophila decipiens]